MKNPLISRIGSIFALIFLAARPSYAEDRAGRMPSVGACAAVYVECSPGARFSLQACRCVPEPGWSNVCPAVECGRGSRMNRMTCACTPDNSGDFHPYAERGEVAPASREFSALGQRVSAISSAMGNQDMSKVSEGLNVLFTGSGSKKDSSVSAPVVAGEWGVKVAAAGQKEKTNEAAIAEAAIRAIKTAVSEREKPGCIYRIPSEPRYGGCRVKGTCGK